MPNPNRRLIAVILDRSGSMLAVKDDTEGGLAAFLAEQHTNPAETLVSLYQFSDSPEMLYEALPLADVPSFTLRPSGMTALFDAIGFGISRTTEHIDSLPDDDQPGEVTIVVLTDGQENRSRELTTIDSVRKLVEHQTGIGWRFIFLGAAPDTFTVAGGLGFDRASTLHYGTASTKETLTRAGRATSTGERFTDDDRNATRH
ncbi:hypothetical protein ACIBH1_45575 [Nonomuraea sp. NPDC050663]|uniref:hypothetical protein n=1 Tax=Nonomuraea sp. NPDC050663 TaxID=3364370 RepID=UPI00379A646E